jgi:hypothetical protein
MSGRRLLWMVSPEGSPGWQARTSAGVYQIDHRSIIARFIPRESGVGVEGPVFITRYSTIQEAQSECERHWRETASSNSGRRRSGPGH